MVRLPLLGDPRAVGLEFLERHRELLARRLGQAVHRPHRVPDDPDVDGLDAVQPRSRSGIALDIEATNGHQPVVRTRSTSTWAPSTRTSSTTPMSTMLMPRSAQHGSYTSRSASRRHGRARARSRAPPSSWIDRDAEPGRGRRARRVGGQRAAGAHAPRVCRDTSRRGRRATRPVGRVAHPLPHVARQLLGAERRRRPRGGRRPARSSPSRPPRRRSASGSNVSPHG